MTATETLDVQQLAKEHLGFGSKGGLRRGDKSTQGLPASHRA